MEKNYNTLRKTHFLRNKNKNEMDTEETRLTTQKTPVRDKYCQTDHNHHGCCESVSLLEPGDPPLLQQPVQTAKSGIQQIIECFRSGTKQLKLMLLKEVDTIFECKTCRSLFRGLPNLITHKQFYCLSKVHTDGNPPNEKDKQSQAIKDVLEAVYPKVDKPDYVITLEPIQSNRNAVFQYVTPVEDKNLGKGNASRSAQVQMEKPSAPKPVLIPEPEKTSHTESVKKDLSSSTLSESQSQIPIFAANSVKKASISHPFSCRVCKKDFNCRRSIRRHIKRVHKKKLEDIKKFIEIQRMPTISTTKGTSKVVHTTSSTNCHVCKKSFATKANVRRHIDEVHKGMRRDSASHETAAKPGKSMALEIVSPKSPKTLPNTQKPSVNSDFSLSSCKCPHCKRRYTSRFLLKKHVQIVHKTTLSGIDFKQDKEHNNTANTDSKGKIESANTVDSTSSTPPAPQSELKGLNHANEKKNSLSAQKSKVKHDADSPKTSPGDKKKCRKPKLSAGFDFKQLYCKLCKRQFTSKQNLTKHIELHTDGNSIYVKFYRCPLCTYETRRKRDVIRHITVVHKKTQRALAKITANLESRAVKKPIESVLDKVLIKSGSQKDKTKRLPSRPDGISASPSKKINGGETSIEVKMTKNFSLLKCNKCGKAFAKKTDLDQHKKDHKGNLNSSPVDAKTKGRNTRSKTLL